MDRMNWFLLVQKGTTRYEEERRNNQNLYYLLGYFRQIDINRMCFSFKISSFRTKISGCLTPL